MSLSGSRRLGLVALATFAGLAWSAPARAQFFDFGFHTFREAQPAPPPRMVERGLTRQGYRLLGPLRLNGDVVIADAMSPDRRRMRLVIDPYTGSVLQRFVTAEPEHQRFATRSDGFGEPNVIQGPSTGFFGNGAVAPPPPAQPQARTSPPRQKPRTVARAVPSARSPAESPAAPAASVSAPASPSASSAPARVDQPVVAATPAEAPKSAAPVAAAPKSAPTAPKAGYANGVPINPLD